MLACRRDIKNVKGEIADENTLFGIERDKNIEAIIEK
jgi:hypothetical protein